MGNPSFQNETVSLKNRSEIQAHGRISSIVWGGTIFLFALLLRWIPATYALPYIHYWDEPTYLKLVLNMVKTGDFDHHWYNIPPFFLYQHTVVQTVRLWEKAKDGQLRYVDSLDTTDFGNRDFHNVSILKWSRKYTGLLGACMCLLTYLLARRFFTERIAIAAGVALALMPGHIEHSLFITPDIPVAFMALLTVFCCVRVSHRCIPSHFFCLGILTGLTAATKYNGGCVLVAPLLLLILHPRKDIRFWMALFMGVVMGFTMGFPYWLARYPLFVNCMGEEFFHYNANFVMDGVSNRWGWEFIQYLFSPGMGWILFLLSLSGWGLQLRKRWTSFMWIGLIFPLSYSLLLLSQKANLFRNLMPLTPWLAMGCGLGLISLWDFLRRNVPARFRYAVPIVVATAVAVWIVAPPVKWAITLKRTKETRVQMVNWIRSQAPESQVIGIPYDLHFLDSEIRRMNRPVIILSQSDVHRQSLRGIDLLVCGTKPAHLRWLSVLNNHGIFTEAMQEQRQSAESVLPFIQSQTPLCSILSPSIYPPRSTLASFQEGYWLLDEWPVNPSLNLIPVPSMSPDRWEFHPLGENTFQSDSWEFTPPKINQSIRGNSLRIAGIPYPEGLGVHAKTSIRIPVPPGAKRFLADVGISDDLEPQDPASIQVTITIANQFPRTSPVLRRNSPVWRYDIPVEGVTEILVSVYDAGDGNQFDHGVLGNCGFLFENPDGDRF